MMDGLKSLVHRSSAVCPSAQALTSFRVDGSRIARCSKVAWTGALFSEKIVRVHEFAQAQRQATTADTAAQSVPQMLQTHNALIQVVPPGSGETFPIPTGWCATIG